MRLADLPLNPSRSTLRQFAVLWVVCFLTLAGRHALQQGADLTALLFAGVSLVGVAGVARPALLRPIFVGWMILVFPVAWTTSHVVLALMFFGLFTPLACLFRLRGRDALARHAVPAGETYWAPRPATADLRRYSRQF